MKTPLRALLVLLGIAVSIVLLTWAGGILYWQIRIGGALRSWENTCRATRSGGNVNYNVPADAFMTLRSSGCRALPQLVDALDSTTNLDFQEGVMERIFHLTWGQGPATDQEFRLLQERWSQWNLENVPQRERAPRIASFKTWWRENGRRYHRGYRFWSNWCFGE